ncbi:hypothetical protein OK016_29520 [Vibrio chagasii]|nr:hypothetical protein [Vibrio chagasii]
MAGCVLFDGTEIEVSPAQQHSPPECLQTKSIPNSVCLYVKQTGNQESIYTDQQQNINKDTHPVRFV